MRIWTEEQEQKQKQREAIKRWAPWQKSTGPRTKEGKQKSARNSYKHGMRSAPWLKLRANLYSQRLYLKWVEGHLARVKSVRRAKARKNRVQSNELLKRTRKTASNALFGTVDWVGIYPVWRGSSP